MIRRMATLLVVAASTMALATVSTAAANPAPLSDKEITEIRPMADSKVLNFTWYGQQTGYWCGPGSTQIAISSRRTPPSQQQLANFMGTHTGGTDHIGLVRNALNNFIGTSWFETKAMYDPPTAAQRNLLVRDVVLNMDNNFPIVTNVISGWRPPGYPGGTIYHYVAVMGYRAGGHEVLIADPAAAGSGGGGWGNVPRTYWISTHNLGTWIGGKGYAA